MPIDSPSQPSVLIVMLNYREPDATRVAVASLLAMNYSNFSVLLIENGSGDNSAAKLRELETGNVELFVSPVNLGYTGGVNLGLRRALERDVDFVWMLNNDAVVPPATLRSLVALAQSDPAIGCVSPRIAALAEVSSSAPRLTFAGGILDVKAGLYDETCDPDEAARWTSQYPRHGLVIGTAMLVSTRILRQAGLLDERFFMYFDDMDLCARTQALGLRNLVDAGATIFHHEKNPSRDPLSIEPHFWYFNARNRIRFWRKYRGLAGSLRLTADAFNRYLRLRAQLHSKPASVQAIEAGLWHGLLDRGGAWQPSMRAPAWFRAACSLYARRPALRRDPPGAPPSRS